jgi:hypothetical protein
MEAMRIVLGVPKKLLRRAVDRNRIKRLAKESFGAFVRDGRLEPPFGPVAWLARLERSPELASFEALSLGLRKRRYRTAFDALLEQAHRRLTPVSYPNRPDRPDRSNLPDRSNRHNHSNDSNHPSHPNHSDWPKKSQASGAQSGRICEGCA